MPINEIENGWQKLHDYFEKDLQGLKEKFNDRRLTNGPEIANAKDAIDLTTNDYLGFNQNQQLAARTLDRVSDLPLGSTASRLLGGDHPIFNVLESEFALFKGSESALFFNSGYAANEAVIQVLAKSGASFYSDELNHASIIDGIRLAKIDKVQKHIFPHQNFYKLEELLSRDQSATKIIVTETVFSMDGDCTDLKRLTELAQQHSALLVIDEAHAIGVFGEHGAGLLQANGLAHDRIITINTCGKALGVQGALVCGPKWFRDALINHARSFIYSTAPSPWLAAALIESIEMVREAGSARSNLLEISHRLRKGLQNLDLDIGTSQSQIIPVILRENTKTLAAKAHLAKRGVLVAAIRPPTVPAGLSRLRLSLRADLNCDDVAKILQAFASLPRD